MFSQEFVCPQWGRGVGVPACITGHMTRGDGGLHPGGGRGVCTKGGGTSASMGVGVGQTPHRYY